MVTDFTNQGTRLVESFERGLEEQIEARRADNDHKCQELLRVIGKAQADQARTLKSVIKRPVKDLQAEWRRRQESLMNKVAAGLEACAM